MLSRPYILHGPVIRSGIPQLGGAPPPPIFMGATMDHDDPSDDGDGRARWSLADIEANDNWDVVVPEREIPAGPSQAGLYRLGKAPDVSLGAFASISLSERARPPRAAEAVGIEHQVDLNLEACRLRHRPHPKRQRAHLHEQAAESASITDAIFAGVC